jgi:hypothetical protein
MRLLLTAIAALALCGGAGATRCDQNSDGGGGGFNQLPTCGPVYYGVSMYVQGHWWTCIHAAPDHWVLVG